MDYVNETNVKQAVDRASVIIQPRDSLQQHRQCRADYREERRRRRRTRKQQDYINDAESCKFHCRYRTATRTRYSAIEPSIRTSIGPCLAMPTLTLHVCVCCNTTAGLEWARCSRTRPAAQHDMPT